MSIVNKIFSIDESVFKDAGDEIFDKTKPKEVTMIYNPNKGNLLDEKDNSVYIQGTPKGLKEYRVSKLVVLGEILDQEWFDLNIKPMIINNNVRIEYK